MRETAASATRRARCRLGAHPAACSDQVTVASYFCRGARGPASLLPGAWTQSYIVLAWLRLRRLGDAMLRNGENACYNVYVESRGAVMDKALQV